MSEADSFLARWSRRKRSAAARSRGPATPMNSADASEAIAPDLSGRATGRDVEASLADPPLLPPIDLLDAASDITPFLAPGVPAALTREALRKAWASDPAIRDFIGLSENSWDFNAPDGVPGFGSLTAEDVRRLVEHMTGKPDPTALSSDAPERAAPELPPAPAAAAAPAQTAAAAVVPARSEPDEATLRIAATGRRHGAALPR